MKKNILSFGMVAAMLVAFFAFSGNTFAGELAHRPHRHGPPVVVHHGHHYGLHHGSHFMPPPPRHGHWRPYYAPRAYRPAVIVRPARIHARPIVGVYF